MLELPAIGKVSPDVFASLIYPRLGHARSEVLVGPRNGVDVAIIDLGGGRVLATTCDPVFVVPQFGFRQAAWFAVHILASDAAMSGLTPVYLAIDLNLPSGPRHPKPTPPLPWASPTWPRPFVAPRAQSLRLVASSKPAFRS